jgi:hypothetical protein
VSGAKVNIWQLEAVGLYGESLREAGKILIKHFIDFLLPVLFIRAERFRFGDKAP